MQVRCTESAERRVELLHQIAQLYEDAAGDLNAAFVTYARALKEDPASEQTQLALDRVARGTGRFQDLAQVFEQLGASIEDPTLASALYTSSARVYEGDLGDIDTAVARYRRVLDIDPLNLGAAESLERLFRTANRYTDLSVILQRKAEILEESDKKKLALFRAAAIEEDVLERPEEAIAVYQKVLDLDSEDLQRRRRPDQAVPGALAVGGAARRLREEGGISVADPEEKKRIYYWVGATYERELERRRQGDRYLLARPRAGSGRSPGPLTSRRALRAGREKLGESLLNVLTRESEMTGGGSPLEAIETSTTGSTPSSTKSASRIMARAVELYRDISAAADRITSRPCERSKGSPAEAAPSPWPRRPCSSCVYEGSSDWPKSFSCTKCRFTTRSDPFQKVELLHARRAALRRRARQPPVGLRHLRSRPHVRQRERGHAPEPRATGDGGQSVARRRARQYDAELDKLAGDPTRFVELGLRTAQIFEVQLDDVEQRHPAIQARGGRRSGESGRHSRARPLVYADRALGGPRPGARTRPRSLGQPTRSSVPFPPRAGASNAYRRPRGHILAYRDVLATAPDTGRRWMRSRRCLRPGSSSSRSRRSSSLFTGMSASGRSSPRSTRPS